jgi:hypothetical protein
METPVSSKINRNYEPMVGNPEATDPECSELVLGSLLLVGDSKNQPERMTVGGPKLPPPLGPERMQFGARTVIAPAGAESATHVFVEPVDGALPG